VVKLKTDFDTIEAALSELAAGKPIIVADDSDRENEGDVICAAEKISPELINFMATEARGLICLALDSSSTSRLDLKQMVSTKDSMGTAFTVSIDASPKHGVKTGISAADRATTIQVAINPQSQARDLTKPGHIFPLEAVDGGVLRRVGHTEAAVDLSRLAGLHPSGVICEILKTNGEMARRDDLFEFASKHKLKFITIADLVAYRLKRERFVHRSLETNLDDKSRVIHYHDAISNQEHMAFIYGDPHQDEAVLVRIHQANQAKDIFGIMSENSSLLAKSLRSIKTRGSGIVVYLQKMNHDQAIGSDSAKHMGEFKDYGVGAQILADLGLHNIELLSNKPRKFHGLEGYGISIAKFVPVK